MKKQPNKTAVPCRTVDLTHCTLPAQYAMRTECSADSIVIKAALARWVTMWREDSIFLPSADGVSWRLPDLDVVFSLQAAAPGLNQLRWLIGSLMDCHVAAQTLMLRGEYTGERIYEELDKLAERPSDAVIDETKRNIRFGKKYLRDTFHYFDYAAKRFGAELGDIEPYLADQAKRMVGLCERGFGPDEWRKDEATTAAVARHLAEVEWSQSRP